MNQDIFYVILLGNRTYFQEGRYGGDGYREVSTPLNASKYPTLAVAETQSDRLINGGNVDVKIVEIRATYTATVMS